MSWWLIRRPVYEKSGVQKTCTLFWDRGSILHYTFFIRNRFIRNCNLAYFRAKKLSEALVLASKCRKKLFPKKDRFWKNFAEFLIFIIQKFPNP